MDHTSKRLVVNLADVRPIWGIPQWALDEIRAALPPDWEMHAVQTRYSASGDAGTVTDEALEAVETAEVYYGAGFPRSLFERAHAREPVQLRWVHSVAAGVAAVLYPEMRASDLLLTNAAGVHGPPIAETAIAMVLHFARGLDFAVRAQARGEWDKSDFNRLDGPVREVAGTTLGVLGYGGLGRETARRAVALGMDVLALKRTASHGERGVEVLTGDDGLRELLSRSDHLVVTLPETAETRQLIGRDQLELLPRGAVLVNVARGELVDQDALVDALRSGRLRGAGLDVFDPEPLPPDSPLWSLPNVLITPHVSGITPRLWHRLNALFLDNFARYLRGEPLRNRVDKDVGY